MKFFSRSSEPKPDKIRPPIIPQYEPFDWKNLFKRKKYIPWWIILIIIIVLTVLITVYHRQIVDWLTPVSNKIRSLKWGWVIPILILFIISFPPLFGHEIVAILCGIVYGLWIGFAIVAAGTFLGEIGTYFAFKGVLRNKAEKEERRNLNYACLATVTREGGFWFVFIARLSAIPSHLTTAVFATCGVGFWTFLTATFFSLPKQLVTVYLGVIINNPNGSHLVSNIVLGITFLITILAAGYIYWQMRKVRPRLLAEAEALAANGGDTGYHGAGIEMVDEEVQSPLMGPGGQTYQKPKETYHAGPNGKYEPFRKVGYEMPEPYPQHDHPNPYEGQQLGVTGPYTSSGTYSQNASSIDLGAKPVEGRDLV